MSFRGQGAGSLNSQGSVCPAGCGRDPGVLTKPFAEEASNGSVK